MRVSLMILTLLLSLNLFSQDDRDSVYNRCPVFITDTITSNNFFLAQRPCTVKVYRVKGDITIVLEQKDQFLTLFFREKRFRNTTYKINTRPDSRSELAIKYSFKSGDQVSYVDVAYGTVEVTFDKQTEMWKLKVNGMIANLVERSISYYKVRSDFAVK